MKRKLLTLLLMSALVIFCFACSKKTLSSTDENDTTSSEEVTTTQSETTETEADETTTTEEETTSEMATTEISTTEAPKPTEHKHNYTKTVTNPSCTSQGYTTYTCSCGHSYQDNIVNALGHNYSTTTVSPTCTEKGYTIYTCSCGYNYQDNYTDATGHNDIAVITEPTCTEKGYTTYTCTKCNSSYKSDSVDAKGHTEVIDKAVEATTSSTGLTEGKHCSVCNEVLKPQKVIPMLELKPADLTTITFSNDLNEKYIDGADRTIPYNISRIMDRSFEINNYLSSQVQIKIKVVLKKTFQGTVSSIDWISIPYELSKDGIVVKNGSVRALDAEVGTLYEDEISYIGDPGNYVLTFKQPD